MTGRGIPNTLKMLKTVIAFGNPLLDTTVAINDTSLLDKYNLKEKQKEVCADELQNISKDISGYEQKNSAGGCSQNSLRVLQWLLQKQCRAIMVGSVGKDNEAVILKNLLYKDGVQTRYILQDDKPTGRTIALVKDASSTLVAHIGAAENLSVNDLLKVPDFLALLQESNFIYVEGFFLTNRAQTAKYILEFCHNYNKTFIFNICGKYLCHMLPDAVQFFVENADIVFGNECEFKTLAKVMHLESIQQLTEKLIKNDKNKMKQYRKMFIITNGEKPGTYIDASRHEKFEILPIKEADIVDTTAAGDAFTGGFMAGLCRDKCIQECIKIGCYAAYHIIKQTGCTLPLFRPDILD